MSFSPVVGNPKPYYPDSNGDPYVGMRLFFYYADTSTKLDTQTDSTGLVDNTNPIVIGADGYPTGDVMIYGLNGQGYKVIAAPPGSDDPPTSPLWTINKIYPGIYIDSEWINPLTATYIDAQHFSVAGDQTSDYHIGRPIKCTGGADIYTEVVSSTYTTLTTVTTLSDVALNASMNTVYLGIQAADSTSSNRNYYPVLPTETAGNIENINYDYGNLFRYTPRIYIKSILDGTIATGLESYLNNALTDGNVYIQPGSTIPLTNPIDLELSNRTIVAYGVTFKFNNDWVHTREGTPYEQLYFFNFGTDATRPNTAGNTTVSNVNIYGAIFDADYPTSVGSGQVIYKPTVIEIGIGSSDIRIIDCEIRDHRDQSGGSRGSIFGRTGTQRITVDRCRFINTDEADAHGGGAVVFSGTDCHVTNCTFENLYDASISFDDGAYCTATKNILRLDAVDGSGSLISVGNIVQIAHGSHHCIFADNVINGVSQAGISLFSTSAENYDNVISNNTIDGGGAVADGSASYLIKCDEYTRNTTIIGNTLSNPSNTAAASACIYIYPRNNIVCDNILTDWDENRERTQQNYRGISLRFDNDPTESFIATNNIIAVGNSSILLTSGDYLNTKQITIENNTFIAGTSNDTNNGVYAINYSNTGTKYIRINDNSYDGEFGSDWAGTWHLISYFQTTRISHKRPNTKLGYNTKIVYFSAAPSIGTWAQGDIIYDITPDASGQIGWVCVTSGTFSSATDATGDTDGSTAVITGMTDTSDFNTGDFVTVSAGFPSAAIPYEIISKTATSVTLDTVSTSVQSNVTVATVDPTFKTFGAISA